MSQNPAATPTKLDLAGFPTMDARDQVRAFIASHANTPDSGVIGASISRLRPVLSYEPSASFPRPESGHTIQAGAEFSTVAIPADLADHIRQPPGLDNPLSQWLSVEVAVMLGMANDAQAGRQRIETIAAKSKLAAFRESKAAPDAPATTPAAPGSR
jgi:hypothetical protein